MGDKGKDPIPEFVKVLKLSKRFKNVEILWASVREAYNYLQAKQLGMSYNYNSREIDKFK